MTRKEEDSIMFRKNEGQTITKVDTTIKDILHAKVNIIQNIFRIILVYIIVNDHNRNNNTQKEIENILDNHENDPII